MNAYTLPHRAYHHSAGYIGLTTYAARPYRANYVRITTLSRFAKARYYAAWASRNLAAADKWFHRAERFDRLARIIGGIALLSEIA